ncbi:hypothetical protein GQ53DRAFT_662534, partial [Thozetella sp. PMI_491]
RSLGQDHPTSLQVTDLLGSTLWFLGRWSEAKAIHTRNLEGMKKVYGIDHENTFRTIRTIANIHRAYLEYEEAAEYLELAWHKLKQRLGESHSETLTCLEQLAISRSALAPEHAAKGDEIMTSVLEIREKTMGPEHPYTLVAMGNAAHIKSLMGRHGEAAKLIKEALTIAKRAIPESHLIIMGGRAFYAHFLSNDGRCSEVEDILLDVTDKEKYKAVSEGYGDHPDRIRACWYLALCYQRQGKFQDALDTCANVLDALKEIGQGKGMNHKMFSMVGEKIEELTAILAGSSCPPAPEARTFSAL